MHFKQIKIALSSTAIVSLTFFLPIIMNCPKVKEFWLINHNGTFPDLILKYYVYFFSRFYRNYNVSTMKITYIFLILCTKFKWCNILWIMSGLICLVKYFSWQDNLCLIKIMICLKYWFQWFETALKIILLTFSKKVYNWCNYPINMFSENCLKQTLNKPESCINRTLNKVQMYEIFVNLTCINQTLVYS